MIVDARSIPDGTELQADVCIVGAGAAGITLARRLSSEQLSVCLLESGGFEYDEATQDLYKGLITGRAYHELDVARLRFFGGSTNHWSGWCSPLGPIDLEPRPYLPSDGWRIRYADLARYFVQAAETCQLPRTSFRVEDYHSQLPELYRQPLARYGLCPRVWQLSPPTRFGEAYGPELEAAQTVRCLLGANVVGIVVKEDGGLICRIDVKSLSGNAMSVTSKTYVLAAGGIENARLLLQPTDSRRNGVGNGSDHPCSPSAPSWRSARIVRSSEPPTRLSSVASASRQQNNFAGSCPIMSSIYFPVDLAGWRQPHLRP